MKVIVAELHPAIRKMTTDFIASAKESGIDLRLTFGTRTFAQQLALFNQDHDGKDNNGNGIIDETSEHVTNAKPGQSFHNYGLAIDVCPFVNGKPDWDSKLWPKIAAIGKAIGFDWGGDWVSIKDKPHFQYPRNTKYTTLLALKNSGKVDKEGFIILT